MNISIICVGKLKEKYLKDAVAEYSKRLSRFCKLNIIEVPDEKTPDNASIKEEILIKEKEGTAILKQLPTTGSQNSYIIVLDLKGELLSSEELASSINKITLSGKSDIFFIIGGSLGISQDVLNRSDFKLCFSKMTFPHQLMRVFLLEQIYRSFKIINGEPYHK